MKKSRKAVKRAHKHHHVIATVPPEQVHGALTQWTPPPAEPAPEKMEIADEQHVIVAVPKSTWEKIKGWLAKEFE
jgi:hypothetical protein